MPIEEENVSAVKEEPLDEQQLERVKAGLELMMQDYIDSGLDWIDVDEVLDAELTESYLRE